MATHVRNGILFHTDPIDPPLLTGFIKILSNTISLSSDIVTIGKNNIIEVNDDYVRINKNLQVDGNIDSFTSTELRVEDKVIIIAQLSNDTSNNAVYSRSSDLSGIMITDSSNQMNQRSLLWKHGLANVDIDGRGTLTHIEGGSSNCGTWELQGGGLSLRSLHHAYGFRIGDDNLQIYTNCYNRSNSKLMDKFHKSIIPT